MSSSRATETPSVSAPEAPSTSGVTSIFGGRHNGDSEPQAYKDTITALKLDARFFARGNASATASGSASASNDIANSEVTSVPGVSDTGATGFYRKKNHGIAKQQSSGGNLNDVTSKVKIVPYTGGATSKDKDSMKFDEFEDWVDYLAYCKMGPQIVLICRDDCTDDPNIYNIIRVSMKLWSDNSAYFKAACSHEWKETFDGQLSMTFDDISVEDVFFLNSCLEAGPRGFPSKSADNKLLRRLARAHELADRFLLKCVMHKMRMMAWSLTTKDINSPKGNWRSIYNREMTNSLVHDIDKKAKREYHEDKLIDYSLAVETIVGCPEWARLLPLEHLMHVILDHAPQMLVARMVKPIALGKGDSRLEVNETFKTWVFWHMAVKNT